MFKFISIFSLVALLTGCATSVGSDAKMNKPVINKPVMKKPEFKKPKMEKPEAVDPFVNQAQTNSLKDLS